MLRAAPWIAWYRLRGSKPRDYRGQWETYWSRARSGNGENDVLWDLDDDHEISEALDRLEEHLDRSLPFLDLGCGNGRRARFLAGRFERVVGVDVSAAAVELARSQWADGDGLDFRVLDGTDREAVEQLAAEHGPMNIYMRGVFHVIHERDREAFITNLARLLGDRGTLYQIETDGQALRYFLAHPEKSPSGLPVLMHKVVSAGIVPHGFGETDCRRWYQDRGWSVLHSGPGVLRTQHVGGEPGRVPAFVAIVRPPA